MDNIRKLIEKYKPQLRTMAYSKRYQDWDRLWKELKEKICEVTDAKDEIIEYYKSAIKTQDWEDEHFWSLAAISHPSVLYLDYFFEILKMDNNTNSVVYWRILDVLTCMPKECENRIVKELEKTIVLDNPSWDEDVLKKAFEDLAIWLGEEDDVVQFFESQLESKSERIAKMAEYWIKWVNDDWDE